MRRRLELGFLRAADTAMAESKAEREGGRERERETKSKWRRNSEGFYGVLEAQSRVANL